MSNKSLQSVIVTFTPRLTQLEIVFWNKSNISILDTQKITPDQLKSPSSPETHWACWWNARCSLPRGFEMCWGQRCSVGGLGAHYVEGDSHPRSRCWNCPHYWMRWNCANLRSCLRCSSAPCLAPRPWALHKRMKTRRIHKRIQVLFKNYFILAFALKV